MIRRLALAALIAWAGQGMAQDKVLSIAAQVCAACHAADGNGTAAANPKLSGQFREYLHKQLVDFKAQGGKKAARESAIMAGMVANLSAAEMKGLAAFYAGQTLRPSAATDKDLAALGQKIWRGGSANGAPACAGCHGPAGAGMAAQYPRVAGQFAEYVAAQLKLFREGGRANDQNGVMRGVAARLNDREMRAVAEYAAGLR